MPADTTDRRHWSAPPEARGHRLDAWLATQCSDLSRSRIKGLIDEGHVLLNGQTVRASHRLSTGQTIDLVVPPPTPMTAVPQPIPLNIVFEDADIIVLNKPPGLVVHPAPGHPDGTLVNALLHHCPDLAGIGGALRPGIVHRLDRLTSGLLVVAKHDKSMAGLVDQFKTGRVAKCYMAAVHGCPTPAAGTIRTRIGRHRTQRKRMSVRTTLGKEAVTHYQVRTNHPPVALLDVRIETGRTHQIRVHMAHLQHPIVGDLDYGNRKLDGALCTPPPRRQLLHAAGLAIEHPCTGESLSFNAPPPEDMANWLQAAGLV